MQLCSTGVFFNRSNSASKVFANFSNQYRKVVDFQTVLSSVVKA